MLTALSAGQYLGFRVQGSTGTYQGQYHGNTSMSSIPCCAGVSCCAYMAACLQMESAANIAAVPNSDSLQQHIIRGDQGAEASQAASQAASWAPPNSANAAAPTAARPSSLQQPTTNRAAALSTSQPTPTMLRRPSAPYLSSHAGFQSSRHRQHPVSAAAVAVADKRQLAQERRLNVQYSSRLKQLADNATAAAGGERLLTQQRVALHPESLAACVTRQHSAEQGIIDLTADGCVESPSTSASSDCMILGASAAPQNPMASSRATDAPDWAQAGPSFAIEEPVEPSRGAQSTRSAEAGVAEPWQSSDAAMQLPQGDWLADLSSGSASARAAAEPWQSSGLASQVAEEDSRPADVRGVSARPRGATLAPLREPSAHLTLPSASAQAACPRRKRSRWDVMPESMSADSTSARHPPPSEAPHDLPLLRSESYAAQCAGAETTSVTVPVLSQAKRQPLHDQQPTAHPQEVYIDSRLEQSEAATQHDVHRAYRSPDRAQQPKQSCTGRKNSRHSRHRESSRGQRSQRRNRSSSSHHTQTSHNYCRQWRIGSPDARFMVDGHCISRSSSAQAEHVRDPPDMMYAQIDAQRQVAPDTDKRLHAAMHREASQGDRWQMWQPQDV